MKEIKIYSTKNCKYCVHAKDYFDQNNINYTVCDVGSDMNHRAEMIKMTGQMGVPVIDFGGKFMVGWDIDKFKELYEKDSTEEEK